MLRFINYSIIKKMLAIVFIFDILLFGGADIELFKSDNFGGRVSIRMVLTVIIFLYFVISCVLNRYKFKSNKIAVTSFVLFCYCIFSFSYGVILNNDLSMAIADFRPELSLILFFPILSIFDSKSVKLKNIYGLLLVCSVIISLFSIIFYLSNITGIIFGPITMLEMQKYIVDMGERASGGIVFSGDIVVLIALLFITFKSLFSHVTFKEKIMAAIFSIVILQTAQRGLVLTYAIFIVAFIMGFKLKKQSIKGIVLLFSIAIFAFIALNSYDFSRVFDYSDGGIGKRLDFLESTIEAFAINPLLGTGYGVQTIVYGNFEVLRLEISYIEILLKQGLIGLLLWCYICWLTIERCCFIYKRTNNEYAILAVIFSGVVIIMSFTNPYLNNGYGISLMLLSVGICQLIEQEEVLSQ